jgi:hypothetical protein
MAHFKFLSFYNLKCNSKMQFKTLHYFWQIERVSEWGKITKCKSNFQILLKLVPLETLKRVRIVRDMDHVARHLEGEVTTIYCFCIHHLNPTCISGFEHALILLQYLINEHAQIFELKLVPLNKRFSLH